MVNKFRSTIPTLSRSPSSGAQEFDLVLGSKLHWSSLTDGRARSAALLLAALSGLAGLGGGIPFARAGDDVRTLTFFHTHTKEQATITFWRDGGYDSEGLERLNWFLRDWRVDEPAKMDPVLFTVLWEVYREAGSREPINIISAYRSPQTNAMLRNRSKGVSEQSQHIRGKAMDIRLPDVDTARLRAIAMRMQYGGVGFYPSSDFVHVDTGSVRAWPRMSQEQLARLFPDGKTLHLPPSGKPLARYQEAKAEILSRNQALASAAGPSSPVTGLLAALFKRGSKPAGDPEPQAATTTASLPSAQEVAAAADPMIPLPPPRPVAATAAFEMADARVEPMRGEGGRSDPEPVRRFGTEASNLLFSAARVGHLPPGDGSRTAARAPTLLPAGSLTAARVPSYPQRFGSDVVNGSDEQRFTGPAVDPRPIRLAQASR
jgi:uncharacterized protein YcbK (DUF882 family)